MPSTIDQIIESLKTLNETQLEKVQLYIHKVALSELCDTCCGERLSPLPVLPGRLYCEDCGAIQD